MIKKLKLSRKDCDPHKELFKLRGEDRYEAIEELPARDLHFICGFYAHCDECPLALYHENGHGLCTEIATETAVRTALRYGAKFVGEENLVDNKEVGCESIEYYP